MIKGAVASMFAVAGFGILLNLFNSAVRKKMIDQTKLRRIMKETRAWQKERISAMRAKDQSKTNELNKKICLHEQNVYGDNADEHEAGDDYICAPDIDLLSGAATTILIYCSTIPHTAKRNTW